MPTPDPHDLLAILQEHYKPREEGWLWVALLRDGEEGGVLLEIARDGTDLRQLVPQLVQIVGECGVERCLFALCRGEGRPTEADREVWRKLRHEMADGLLDLVVFNDQRLWSMRREDADAAAAAG
ncbi:MAG: hypothetical protein QOK42_1912 [Frankiaceae bacterium]|jgi:hypothetical protein|nr:hypothetical protein [Frankiaceae bacterium]MDX6223909.1 hypothetical protein [Frankiales bacterium]